MINRLLSVLAGLAIGLCPVLALANDGKVYKIVDENGKIRFTNQPTVIVKEQAPAEEVEVKAAQVNKTVLTQVGDNEFCGEILLPAWPDEEGGRFSSQRRSFFSDLLSRMRSWSDSVNRIEDEAHQVEYYSARSRHSHKYSTQSRNNRPEQLEQARDYRCAIAWGEEKQKELIRFEEFLLQEIERNKQYIELQTAIRDRTCGQEPVFNPKTVDYDVEQRRDKWRKCIDPIQSLIDKAYSEKKDMNRELELIYRAEKDAGARS